jgi:hypothetical protein
MVEKRKTIKLERRLTTIHDAENIFKLREIFEFMQQKDDTDLSISQRILSLAVEVSKFFGEIDRKIKFLNTLEEYSGFGDIFLSNLDKEVRAGNISISEVYFLTNIAYFRVEKHFDPGGKYLPEHEDKDDDLIFLPLKYVELKQKIKPLENSTGLTKEQSERLDLFLMYLQMADLDFDINDLPSVCKRFEEEMEFCKQIPEEFHNIYRNKQTGFTGSWRRYKLSEKNKESAHYIWMVKVQSFEKTHPTIGTAIQIYVSDYDNKQILNTSNPLEFETESPSS